MYILLRYLENIRVVKLEYRSSSFESEWKIQFTNFELKTNGDLKVMWSTFQCYASKDRIEMNVKIARSVDYIINILQRHQISLYNNM